MPILDHFSWLAPWYDRLASPPDVQYWQGVLQLPCAGWLLDVGGGTGRLSHPMRELTGGVVLVDVAFGMLIEAQRKASLRIAMSEGEQLAFPSDCFDRIMMVDALHHVRDQKLVARELARVLKTNGRLVIIEPDIDSWAIRLVALFEKLLLMRSHFLRADEIAALFADENLRVQITKRDRSIWVSVEKRASGY